MFAHIDADSFFASVLQRKDPRLKGKPLIALGLEGAGIVIAATYEAKATGVKTGMRLTDALQLCPEAVCIPSDFRETGVASRELAMILQERCPRVEQMSVDEWYLDLRTLPGGLPPVKTPSYGISPSSNIAQWAQNLRQEILRRTALSVSIGVAPTKLLAKMAGEYRKPGGITVVNKQQTNNSLPIATFLKDRPAAAIPGIGPRRVIHANIHGWKTAWDIACASPDRLRTLFGRPGIDMQRELRGIPVMDIKEKESPQSISRARSFKSTADRAILWAHVLRHLEYIVLKMRRNHLACRGITAWLRGGPSDYEFYSRSHRLPQPMNTEERLRPFVQSCFQEIWNVTVREGAQTITQTGLALWDLRSGGPEQYSLFTDPMRLGRDASLQGALDALHEQFGRASITCAAALSIEPLENKHGANENLFRDLPTVK